MIHSVPVWALAETGLLGAVIIYGFGLYFVISSWKEARAGPGPGLTLIGIMLVFFMYQILHDVFYQRAAWILLGVPVAKRAVRNRPTQGRTFESF